MEIEFCPDCKADRAIRCPRNTDAQCLECGQAFCGAHIAPHLAKVHCIALTLDHCRRESFEEGPV